MASRKQSVRRQIKRKPQQRRTSSVFTIFDKAQIEEFKEAFNMIDQNRDGFIDKDDLQEILRSMGKNPTDDELQEMMNMASGPINFTMFLTIFGEKLSGTDPEDVIKNAFGCFDAQATGFIPEEYLRECLMTMGDRWSEEQVDELFHEAPISEGLFDYVKFTRTIKHGAKDKDDQGQEDEGQGQGQAS